MTHAADHSAQVRGLLESWAASQVQPDGDRDEALLWGPLRLVAHALQEKARQARVDGVVRGERRQQFAVTQLPPEHVFAQAVDEDRAVTVGIDLVAQVAPGAAQPGSVASGEVRGLVPAQRAVTTAVDVHQVGVQVVHTPHGWRVIDVAEDVRGERAWFSSRFCVHGFALPLPADDTEDQVALKRAVSCGLVFRSLAAHVRTGPAGLTVAHTLQVSNGRSDDVVVCFGVTHGGRSRGPEPGHLLPAHSIRVLQLPKASSTRVFAPLRLRTESGSRLRRDSVEQLRIGVSIPGDDHPREGWCRVPVAG